MGFGESNVLPITHRLKSPDKLIVIGANTGGHQALINILPQLPRDFPATVVVMQQMRPGFSRVLTGMVNRACTLHTCEPEDGDVLQSGTIIVTPGDACLLLIEGDPLPLLSIEQTGADSERTRNRTNATMTSAAAAFGRNAIGVLLSGLGDDGRDGMRAIAEAGGVTIAQDEASSVVHDLPGSAIAAGAAQEVLPLWNIAERLIGLVMGEANAAAA